MENILKQITGYSRSQLVKQRLNIVAQQTAEGGRYYRELPVAIALLDAAKTKAYWPANTFPSNEMSEANSALIALNDRHAAAIAGFAKTLEPIEAGLRESTDYDVDNFISDLISDMDATRRKFASIVEHGKLNPLTWKRHNKVWTNAKEISERVDALFKARDYVDQQLRYIENLKDLPAEFARIRASLPHVPAREVKAEDHAAT